MLASPACACVRARACVWTLKLSTLPPSTFHKTVSTCLLQVLLATNTSCAHAPQQLVTGSVLLDSASQHPTQPQLSSAYRQQHTRLDSLPLLFTAAQHSPFFIPAFFISLLFRRAFPPPHSHLCHITDLAWLLVRVNADHVQGALQIQTQHGTDRLGRESTLCASRLATGDNGKEHYSILLGVEGSKPHCRAAAYRGTTGIALRHVCPSVRFHRYELGAKPAQWRRAERSSAWRN